jgi:hypothetical protein
MVLHATCPDHYIGTSNVLLFSSCIPLTSKYKHKGDDKVYKQIFDNINTLCLEKFSHLPFVWPAVVCCCDNHPCCCVALLAVVHAFAVVAVFALVVGGNIGKRPPKKQKEQLS